MGLLEMQGVETCYGASQVLFGVNLEVRAGEVATLMGRNGMGKTTTVRSIMGLTPPSGGGFVLTESNWQDCRPIELHNWESVTCRKGGRFLRI